MTIDGGGSGWAHATATTAAHNAAIPSSRLSARGADGNPGGWSLKAFFRFRGWMGAGPRAAGAQRMNRTILP
jgi:hypothetical protein